jgi:hypothetical protein
MIDTSFDAVARRAAERMSRRGSLLALGAAGLAGLAAPLPARARKKKKGPKKQRRPPAFQKCRRERDDCKLILTIAPPETAACCDFLATCDAAAFLQCLLP